MQNRRVADLFLKGRAGTATPPRRCQSVARKRICRLRA